ncbi:MAG: class A beta-lactamase-related serine hydrolase [Candidatus Eremiobacteraeota bacterium]|nr:class A beta-lactamase-related serine hydrolase [Candidatus Eremiobacteraeota bacterium]
MTDILNMRRLLANAAISIVAVFSTVLPARAYVAPPPLANLRGELHKLASRFPASSAVEVMDLSTGYSAAYNAGASMPAASTIKVPVMVEVFRQLEAGRFDLHRRIELLASDKDYGSGDLCDEPVGSTHDVAELLSKMIDVSDNTATNMLIRLVGRTHINVTMENLGLERTHLTQDVRTSNWSVRLALRSSASDMVHLLSMMARRSLIDEWSSNEMISILEDDRINTLLPQPLPEDVTVAHKTGSFFDTLNDVGIVYANDAPYVIAVMTTHLPSLGQGRTFIRSLSKMAFTKEMELAAWRNNAGLQSFNSVPAAVPPDVRYWENSADDATSGGR